MGEHEKYLGAFINIFRKYDADNDGIVNEE